MDTIYMRVVYLSFLLAMTLAPCCAAPRPQDKNEEKEDSSSLVGAIMSSASLVQNIAGDATYMIEMNKPNNTGKRVIILRKRKSDDTLQTNIDRKILSKNTFDSILSHSEDGQPLFKTGRSMRIWPVKKNVTRTSSDSASNQATQHVRKWNLGKNGPKEEEISENDNYPEEFKRRKLTGRSKDPPVTATGAPITTFNYLNLKEVQTTTFPPFTFSQRPITTPTTVNNEPKITTTEVTEIPTTQISYTTQSFFKFTNPSTSSSNAAPSTRLNEFKLTPIVGDAEPLTLEFTDDFLASLTPTNGQPFGKVFTKPKVTNDYFKTLSGQLNNDKVAEANRNKAVSEIQKSVSEEDKVFVLEPSKVADDDFEEDLKVFANRPKVQSFESVFGLAKSSEENSESPASFGSESKADNPTISFENGRFKIDIGDSTLKKNINLQIGASLGSNNGNNNNYRSFQQSESSTNRDDDFKPNIQKAPNNFHVMNSFKVSDDSIYGQNKTNTITNTSKRGSSFSFGTQFDSDKIQTTTETLVSSNEGPKENKSENTNTVPDLHNKPTNFESQVKTSSPSTTTQDAFIISSTYKPTTNWRQGSFAFGSKTSENTGRGFDSSFVTDSPIIRISSILPFSESPSSGGRSFGFAQSTTAKSAVADDVNHLQSSETTDGKVNTNFNYDSFGLNIQHAPKVDEDIEKTSLRNYQSSASSFRGDKRFGQSTLSSFNNQNTNFYQSTPTYFKSSTLYPVTTQLPINGNPVTNKIINSYTSGFRQSSFGSTLPETSTKYFGISSTQNNYFSQSTLPPTVETTLAPETSLQTEETGSFFANNPIFVEDISSEDINNFDSSDSNKPGSSRIKNEANGNSEQVTENYDRKTSETTQETLIEQRLASDNKSPSSVVESRRNLNSVTENSRQKSTNTGKSRGLSSNTQTYYINAAGEKVYNNPSVRKAQRKLQNGNADLSVAQSSAFGGKDQDDDDDLERGSKKFNPSKFDTISFFHTDSHYKQYYDLDKDGQQVLTRTDGRFDIEANPLVDGLDENDISDGEKKKKSKDNAYRGNIKFKLNPYSFSDYDDDDNNAYVPNEFDLKFNTSTGISAYQKGTAKYVNNRKVFVVNGFYEYTSPEGIQIYVCYTADELGFKILDKCGPTGKSTNTNTLPIAETSAAKIEPLEAEIGTTKIIDYVPESTTYDYLQTVNAS